MIVKLLGWSTILAILGKYSTSLFRELLAAIAPHHGLSHLLLPIIPCSRVAFCSHPLLFLIANLRVGSDRWVTSWHQLSTSMRLGRCLCPSFSLSIQHRAQKWLACFASDTSDSSTPPDPYPNSALQACVQERNDFRRPNSPLIPRVLSVNGFADLAQFGGTFIGGRKGPDGGYGNAACLPCYHPAMMHAIMPYYYPPVSLCDTSALSFALEEPDIRSGGKSACVPVVCLFSTSTYSI